MASYIQRRKFLATLRGGVAAGGARAAAGDAGGGNSRHSPATTIEERRMNAFRLGLGESAEGQNVRFEYRLAEGRYDRMSMLAADLVNRQVSMIVAPRSSVAANAAKAATATIPSFLPLPMILCTLNRPAGSARTPEAWPRAGRPRSSPSFVVGWPSRLRRCRWSSTRPGL